jgi:hypothetical protein
LTIEVSKILATDQLGRKILQRCNQRKPLGFIILTYPSRALEWLNLRNLFTACLKEFHYEHLVPAIDELMFAWRYHSNLSTVFYKPAVVFKNFAFLQLLDPVQECICLKSKRLSSFVDSRTKSEQTSFALAQVHVRTVDIKIIHHKRLREALAMELNHIPNRPTDIAVSVATALDGFCQCAHILGLDNGEFPLEAATEWVRTQCLEQLKIAQISLVFVLLKRTYYRISLCWMNYSGLHHISFVLAWTKLRIMHVLYA